MREIKIQKQYQNIRKSSFGSREAGRLPPTPAIKNEENPFINTPITGVYAT